MGKVISVCGREMEGWGSEHVLSPHLSLTTSKINPQNQVNRQVKADTVIERKRGVMKKILYIPFLWDVGHAGTWELLLAGYVLKRNPQKISGYL